MTEAEQRQAVIEEAHRWLRTPYHHAGAVRGAGVDCLQLLVQVYGAVGVIVSPAVPYYPADFMLHRSEELYLSGILSYAREVAQPGRGDIALWRFGRCFSHAAIVVDWPTIIHAYRREGCVTLGRGDVGELADTNRAVKFFSPWEN
jgi:cell wall-associated NlpC family hydrolase